jgi:hypothetical protein
MNVRALHLQPICPIFDAFWPARPLWLFPERQKAVSLSSRSCVCGMYTLEVLKKFGHKDKFVTMQAASPLAKNYTGQLLKRRVVQVAVE